MAHASRLWRNSPRIGLRAQGLKAPRSCVIDIYIYCLYINIYISLVGIRRTSPGLTRRTSPHYTHAWQHVFSFHCEMRRYINNVKKRIARCQFDSKGERRFYTATHNKIQSWKKESQDANSIQKVRDCSIPLLITKSSQ